MQCIEITQSFFDHHYENPVLKDFFVSSPKFFSARVGGGTPTFRGRMPLKVGSARRRRAAYENFAKNLAGAEGAGEKLALFSSGK